MQIRDHNPSMETYRPSQECLNFFWTLSESGDNKRVEATIQLVKMIQSIEQKPEREKITTYCINRLVRGLGSGRKFARVGFSTALTVMLRLQTELKTKQVLSCFHECFKRNHKASSKAEKSALYLGNAFALTSIIQSGRIMKVDGETLGSIANDLLFLSNKRSFLKPVCCKALEDLLALVSDELFEKHLWPKLQERLMLGWEGCSLDRVCLLLVCREKFPGTVNKKFVKKHWGPSLFDEDNDEKLLAAVQISMEKSRALREKVLPSMIKSGRDTLSIWKGLGEKMFTAGKDNVISQQQLISLEILKELICLTSDTEQVSTLVLDPSVTQAMFMENHTNNPALARTLNDLMSCVCDKLKLEGGDVLSFVRQILQLEGQVEDTEGGRLRFIHTSNFAKIANLMQKSESESYIESLIEFLKGRDENKFFSESGKKRSKQLDWCVRQIQHVCCSQSLTSPDMQRAVLALFIRLAFFKVKDTTDKIVHCDFSDRLVESDRVRQLCSALLLKSLDQLSTMNERHESKVKSFAAYTDLLSYLVHYFQSMLSCNRVELLPNWSEEGQRKEVSTVNTPVPQTDLCCLRQSVS